MATVLQNLNHPLLHQYLTSNPQVAGHGPVKKKIKYDQTTLQDAYSAYKEDERLSIRQAARKFGVVYSELRDHVAGVSCLDRSLEAPHGATGQTDFTTLEEHRICEYFKMMARYTIEVFII